MNVYEQILNRYKVTDTEYEDLLNTVRIVEERILKSCKKHKANAKVIMGGSAAKGTLLKGDFDVDLFVQFSSGKDISKILEKVLVEFKPKVLHGSRDYFQFDFKGILFEVVPVRVVKDFSKIETSTDMSPLHVSWITEKVEENQGLVDEIILAKVFSKGIGVYGAESYQQGFSGHVLDILVCYYGSFKKLLENARDWEEGEIIDIEKYGTAKKIKGVHSPPLIVVDPVYKMRNASAALSAEKMIHFQEQGRQFLAEPHIAYFEKKVFDIDAFRKQNKGHVVYVLQVVTEDGKQDVNGAKLLKCFNYITRHLDINEFVVEEEGWEFDKENTAIFWLAIKDVALSEKQLHTGPPERDEGAKKFREKHADVFIKDGYLFTYIDRKFRKPQQFMSWVLKDEFIRSRVSEIHVL